EVARYPKHPVVQRLCHTRSAFFSPPPNAKGCFRANSPARRVPLPAPRDRQETHAGSEPQDLRAKGRPRRRLARSLLIIPFRTPTLAEPNRTAIVSAIEAGVSDRAQCRVAAGCRAIILIGSTSDRWPLMIAGAS